MLDSIQHGILKTISKGPYEYDRHSELYMRILVEIYNSLLF